MKARFFIIPAVLVALAGCSKEKEQDFIPREETPAPADGTLALTVEATKSMDTKALGLDGTTLKAYWDDGETVGVYLNGTRIGLLSATAQSDNTKARLSGSVPKEGIAEGTTLMLLFPDREDLPVGSKWDYSGQSGVLDDGETACDGGEIQ